MRVRVHVHVQVQPKAHRFQTYSAAQEAGTKGTDVPSCTPLHVHEHAHAHAHEYEYEYEYVYVYVDQDEDGRLPGRHHIGDSPVA